MTNKVTVKANAENFVFDGNEGRQRQATNGAVKQCWYGSHTAPERFR